MERSGRPVTIITGGGRGIGAATALHLARAGHDIVVNYRRDRVAAERVVSTARAEGGRALAVPADVVRPDEVERLFATAHEHLGPVTGLVNNAGLTAHIGALAETPVEVVRLVVDVNLFGAILCARAAARAMSRSRGGSGGAIVNVSSAAATLGSAHEYVHYAAAKAGVEALTLGLAKELAGEGVRVNTVARGSSVPASMPMPATPSGSTGPRPGSHWGGPASRPRSPSPSAGCSARTRPMSLARRCGWPAGSDRLLQRLRHKAEGIGEPADEGRAEDLPDIGPRRTP